MIAPLRRDAGADGVGRRRAGRSARIPSPALLRSMNPAARSSAVLSGAARQRRRDQQQTAPRESPARAQRLRRPRAAILRRGIPQEQRTAIDARGHGNAEHAFHQHLAQRDRAPPTANARRSTYQPCGAFAFAVHPGLRESAAREPCANSDSQSARSTGDVIVSAASPAPSKAAGVLNRQSSRACSACVERAPPAGARRSALLHHPFVFAVRQRRDLLDQFDLRRDARGNLGGELVQHALSVCGGKSLARHDADDPAIGVGLRHLRFPDIAHAVERESDHRAIHARGRRDRRADPRGARRSSR